MKYPGKPIGRVELEVLRYVTEHQPIRVRDVAQHMAEVSGQARTTILTVMERLRAKGFLKRRKIKGVNHYASRVSKSDVVQDVVSDFVDGVLKGSVSPFVAYLNQSSRLTDEEINELKQLVVKLESEEKRGK
jgi:BlaI family penicillinase repressor